FGRSPARSENADQLPATGDLARLLYRWFAAAHLNVVFPFQGGDSLSAQYLALRDVSRSLELDRGQRLFDFSRTHPRGLPELCRRLLRSGRESGAVYLTVTSTLECRELREIFAAPAVREHFADHEIPSAQLPAGCEHAAGPFVLLMSLTATDVGVR